MQKFRHKLEIKLPCMVKYPAVIRQGAVINMMYADVRWAPCVCSCNL